MLAEILQPNVSQAAGGGLEFDFLQPLLLQPLPANVQLPATVDQGVEINNPVEPTEENFQRPQSQTSR